MLEMKYNTIIWDLDGTLLDTLQDLYLAVNHALRTYQLPERTLDEVRQFVGNGVRNLMKRAVKGGEEHPQFEDIFAEFKSYYVVHCQENTGLYPGIAEALRMLKQKGVRMAVVSNKLQAGVDELYKAYFHDCVEVAIGERPGIPRKPQPDMVNLAISELGLDKAQEGIVYVGDSDVDILTAKNSNLPCISVLWGFRDRDFLLQHGATQFAQQPADILRLIEETIPAMHEARKIPNYQ